MFISIWELAAVILATVALTMAITVIVGVKFYDNHSNKRINWDYFEDDGPQIQ